MGALAPVVPVEAKAGMGYAGLQVEGGGLGRPLLVVGRPGKAGGEGAAMRNCITLPAGYRQSSPGMMRNMNSSNIGTVKAVSP